MKTRKFLVCILIPFLFILQSVDAYQELHEPDIIYIEYMSKEGTSNTIRMYESAANTLIRNIGEACFQKLEDSESSVKNKRYLLLNKKNCNGRDTLFFRVLDFYEQAINASSDETIMDKATKHGAIKVKTENKWILKSLYVEVNKKKDIITALVVG